MGFGSWDVAWVLVCQYTFTSFYALVGLSKGYYVSKKIRPSLWYCNDYMLA